MKQLCATQICCTRSYAFAEREYNHDTKEKLLGATQPHKWWFTLKSALFGVDDGMPPLLKPDGFLTHCPKEKATLFANLFDGKQSDEVFDFTAVMSSRG